MPAVAVRTDDFRLAYRLLDQLRISGLEYTQIDLNQPIPNEINYWIGSHSEVDDCNDVRGIGCAVDEIDSVIGSIINRMNAGDSVNRICFGIDPGPRPGLAWLADGRPAGSIQLESVDVVVDQIIDILRDLDPQESVVRIGNGVRTISSRIANVCLARGLSVQLVDESSTSIGSRNNHASAARLISYIEGVPVKNRLRVMPTDGEVREIQRRSRRISEGRFTIPARLARAVAVGRLTLVDAVKIYSEGEVF